MPRWCQMAVVLLLAPLSAALGGDWITEPSYFTHNCAGQRVRQHTAIGPFYYNYAPDFLRSGYRHTRSSLQVGSSVDHFHQVEEWGRAIRPYDEWRFPYRPYSVPYDAWGPPWGNWGYPFPYYPFPGIGFGGYPGVGLGLGGLPGLLDRLFPPQVPYPGYQPWLDDRYPAFDDRAPFRRQPFPQPNFGR